MERTLLDFIVKSGYVGARPRPPPGAEAAMRPQLTIVQLSGSPGSLAVCGEVDIHTVPDLRGSLHGAVHAASPGTVITVDLSAVSFIDACGLTTLVEADAYSSVRGIRLVFADVPANIARLLALIGLSLPAAPSA
jgi:anti-anti-sigma factor